MKAAALLLARNSIRRMRKRWLASALLTLGIGLTTAVFIAVLHASYASVHAFGDSTRQLLAADSIQLRSRLGDFPETAVETWLATLPAEVGIAATLESEVSVVQGNGKELRLEVLGLGLVAAGSSETSKVEHRQVRPGTLHFSQAGLSRYALNPGERAHVRTSGRTETVPVALFEIENKLQSPSDGAAVCDIGSAQRLLGKIGRLTSLVFTTDSQEARKNLLVELTRFTESSAATGSTFFVQTDESRRGMAERLLAAFRSNVLIMVAMAFLVCILTIFNAAQLSTLSARQEYRVLKTLGVPARLLFLSVLLESLLLGGAGTVVGLTLGRPLTHAVSALFLGTVQDLYLGGASPAALGVWPGLRLSAVAGFCAMLTCFLGAFYPAWKVSGSSAGFSHGGLLVAAPIRLRRSVYAGLFVSLLALLSVAIALRASLIVLSHFSALLVVLALFLFSPSMLALCTSGPFRVLLRKARVFGLVALSNTVSCLNSHAFTVGVGASAVSLLIALSVMVGSFRATLQDWVNYTFRADVYVRPEDQGALFAPRFISADSISVMATLPEVQEISRYSVFSSEVDGQLVSIAGADIEMGERRGLYHVLAGKLDIASLRRGESVVLTETAARKLKRSVGDRILFEGRSALVGAVYQDFSSERGTILMDRAAFVSAFPQVGVATLGLYLKPSINAQAVREELKRQFSTDKLWFTLNSDLRTLVFRIFDQTFRITGLMRLIVVLICGLGFVVTILQLMQERQRELKTLYTLGMSWSELRLSMLIEALVLAFPSIVLGSLGGTVLALVLIEVINPLSFGWSFRPVFGWQYYAGAALVVLFSNIVAALVPAWYGGSVVRNAKLSEE